MTLLEEIQEKRMELSDLESQYSIETPPCSNTECPFHRPNSQRGKCSWSVLLEECDEYIAE